MSQGNILNHITSRIKADVDFLVSEGLMSRYDADIVANKLPAIANDEDNSQRGRSGLASPPSSTASTPSTERVMPALRKPPPPAPVNKSIPQAKTLWGYNEDGSELADLSFPAGATIDIIEETNSDWWKGRYNGREGLLPSSYVEKLPASSSNTIPTSGFPQAASSPISSPDPAAHYPHHPGGFMAPSRNGGYMPPPQQNQWGSPSPQPPAPWTQGGGGPPPPQGGYFQPPPPPPEVVAQQDKKKSRFGKYGSQAGSAAASGVGFGAGAAIGGGIVNALF